MSCPRRHGRRGAGSGAGGENLAAGTGHRPEALHGPRPPQRRIYPRSGFWKPGPEYGRFAHAASAPAPIRVTSPDPVAPPAATWRAGTGHRSQIPGTRPAAPGAPGPDPGHPRHQNHRSSGARVLTVPAAPRTPGPSAPVPAAQTTPPEVIRRQAAGRFTPGPRKISQIFRAIESEPGRRCPSYLTHPARSGRETITTLRKPEAYALGGTRPWARSDGCWRPLALSWGGQRRGESMTTITILVLFVLWAAITVGSGRSTKSEWPTRSHSGSWRRNGWSQRRADGHARGQPGGRAAVREVMIKGMTR